MATVTQNDPNLLAALNTGNINSIVSALPQTIPSLQNIPIPQVPTLNYTPPPASGAGSLTDQYNQFLTRAQQDPDIVNYYQNLLNIAQGQTDIAKQLLEQDYTTGVRQTNDNLTNTLKQLGLTFTQEQQSTQDTLNKRGIAVTQNPNNSLSYAGGGESATELGQLNQSQQLRKEAQQRTAQQGIENLGITKQKGLVSAGENLQNTAMSVQQQKEQAVSNRAGTYMGLYTAGQSADLAKAQQQQFQSSLNGGGGGGGGGAGMFPGTNQTIAEHYTGWSSAAKAADMKAHGL